MENPIEGLNGQLMVMAAHRYCLGRSSYIVSSCIEWLNLWWYLFDRNTKFVIVRDTIEALQDDMAGMACDTAAWKEFAEDKFRSLGAEVKSEIYYAVSYKRKPFPLDYTAFVE